MTKIVLLEFIDEFKAFKAYIHQRSQRAEDFLIVAIDPKVRAYLKLRNIPCRDTITYFNNDSHRRILVETEKAMVLIRKHFDFSDEFGLKGCYKAEFALWVRLFINHLLKILEIIKNINGYHTNARWYAYVDDEVSEQPSIGAQERYCGLLTKRFAANHGMEFFNINENIRVGVSLRKARSPFSALEKIFLSVILRILRHKKVIVVPRVESPFRGLINDISKREKDVIFLAIDSRNGLTKVVISNITLMIKSYCFRRQALYCVINVAFFNPLISLVQKDALSCSIDTLMDEKHKEIFTCLSVEYLDLVQKKVEYAIRPHLERMLSYSYALHYILNRLNIYLVMSYVGIEIMAVAGEMARVMNKKSLFISHGTHPEPIDSCHELELYSNCRTFMLGDYTHIALCTPVQEAHLRYFKNKYRNIISEEIKMGPLIFTSLVNRDKAWHKEQLCISSDYYVFTHAVSIKPRNAERFYFLETLDEFFSGVTDIINVINALDKVKLIIRVHPGFHWSNEEIKLLLPASGNYIINREGPFSEVLGATDALISYSSTTIDEALINRIPVLLYDRWNRYNHFKTGIFEQDNSTDVYPVCYVNSCSKLQLAMKFMIRKTKLANPQEMDVKRYCYDQDYRESFYSFIQQSLGYQGNGLAFNIAKNHKSQAE